MAATKPFSPSPAFWPRLVIASLLLGAIIFPLSLQACLSSFYSYLSSSSFYRFSGFETIETVFCYAVVEVLYTYKFGTSPHLRLDARGPIRKRADSGKPVVPKMRRPSERLGEMFTYAAPLLSMDFVMIKKFAGVSVDEIRSTGGYDSIPASKHDISSSFLLPTIHNFKFDSPLQLRRALPVDAPSSRRLVLELLTAFVLYDLLFFSIHLAFHRVPVLARIHQVHHTHAEMHPQVTNRLSVGERLSLVLLANFSLNIIGSHVLTRTLFVPFFVYLLVEIHSGLDLPWGYDKIMPLGLGAGSKIHAIHHRTGQGHYAPFFTWWDRGLQALDSWQSTGKSTSEDLE